MISELRKIRVLAEKIRQGKMKMDLRWEEFSQVFINEIKKSALVVDCGAEYGFYLNLAIQYNRGCQIVAYEPEPMRYEALKEFFKYQNRVHVFPYALMDIDSDIKLYKTDGKSASIDSNLSQWGKVKKYEIKVPGRKLDVLLNGNVPDIIKMDIEGAEVFAMAGMEQLMKTKKPIIFLEYHKRFIESIDPDGPKKIYNLLSKIGYKIYNNYGQECDLDHSRVILAHPDRGMSIEFDNLIGNGFIEKFRCFYNFIESLKKSKYRFLIYGAGSVGKTVASLMPEHIVCMVDKKSINTLTKSEMVDASLVYSIDSISELDFDFILITALGHEDSIISTLKSKFEIDSQKIINLGSKFCNFLLIGSFFLITMRNCFSLVTSILICNNTVSYFF